MLDAPVDARSEKLVLPLAFMFMVAGWLPAAKAEAKACSRCGRFLCLLSVFGRSVVG
jgi:hypothetical protein